MPGNQTWLGNPRTKRSFSSLSFLSEVWMVDCQKCHVWCYRRVGGWTSIYTSYAKIFTSFFFLILIHSQLIASWPKYFLRRSFSRLIFPFAILKHSNGVNKPYQTIANHHKLPFLGIFSVIMILSYIKPHQTIIQHGGSWTLFPIRSSFFGKVGALYNHQYFVAHPT